MARSDPPLQAKIPEFVHRELDELLRQLGGEGSKTRLVAALVHAATLESARDALRQYSDEIARPELVALLRLLGLRRRRCLERRFHCVLERERNFENLRLRAGLLLRLLGHRRSFTLRKRSGETE